MLDPTTIAHVFIATLQVLNTILVIFFIRKNGNRH